jgi:hypothetical protein
VVEIDEQHRQRLAGALRSPQRVIDAVDEQRPVRKAGERVVQPLVGEALSRLLALTRADEPG